MSKHITRRYVDVSLIFFTSGMGIGGITDDYSNLFIALGRSYLSNRTPTLNSWTADKMYAYYESNSFTTVWKYCNLLVGHEWTLEKY